MLVHHFFFSMSEYVNMCIIAKPSFSGRLLSITEFPTELWTIPVEEQANEAVLLV